VKEIKAGNAAEEVCSWIGRPGGWRVVVSTGGAGFTHVVAGTQAPSRLHCTPGPSIRGTRLKDDSGQGAGPAERTEIRRQRCTTPPENGAAAARFGEVRWRSGRAGGGFKRDDAYRRSGARFVRWAATKAWSQAMWPCCVAPLRIPMRQRPPRRPCARPLLLLACFDPTQTCLNRALSAGGSLDIDNWSCCAASARQSEWTCSRRRPTYAGYKACCCRRRLDRFFPMLMTGGGTRPAPPGAGAEAPGAGCSRGHRPPPRPRWSSVS